MMATVGTHLRQSTLSAERAIWLCSFEMNCQFFLLNHRICQFLDSVLGVKYVCFTPNSRSKGVIIIVIMANLSMHFAVGKPGSIPLSCCTEDLKNDIQN